MYCRTWPLRPGVQPRRGSWLARQVCGQVRCGATQEVRCGTLHSMPRSACMRFVGQQHGQRPHICLMATASPLRVSMPLNTWPKAPRPSSSPNAYRSLSICLCPVPSTPLPMLPAAVDVPMALKLLFALLARLGDALRMPRVPDNSAPAGPGRGDGVSGTAASIAAGAQSLLRPSPPMGVGVARFDAAGRAGDGTSCAPVSTKISVLTLRHYQHDTRDRLCKLPSSQAPRRLPRSSDARPSKIAEFARGTA